MGRTPGAKNKTPREMRAEATHLLQIAKLKEKLAAEKKKKGK